MKSRMESTLDQQEIKSRYLTKSLVFGNPVSQIIDLGMHPFADTFISHDQLSFAEPVFPLSCTLDEVSGLIHNEYLTPDVWRYNLYDYSYTSSNSAFSRQHWSDFAQFIKKLLINANSKVVEVGSNDGYLCLQLKELGFEILGIDSASAMCKISNASGIETIEASFSRDSANEIKERNGGYDCLIANNVLNHANNPLDFISGVDILLNPKGYFVFEVPYWSDLVDSGHFDQIYHEHVSYFTVFSIKNLLSLVGFCILNVSRVDYHGGSLRIVAGRFSDYQEGESSEVESSITLEKSKGLFKIDSYSDFRRRIQSERSRIMSTIHEHIIKTPDVPIIGVGAAAKANTFLNYYGLNSSFLLAVTDSSPLKQGKYTPLTRIPIVSDEIFANYTEVSALILSWNLSDKLKTVLLGLNPKIRFLL